MMPELKPQRIKIPTRFFYRRGGAAAKISRARQERLKLQMVMQFGVCSFPGNYLHTRTEYRELLQLLAYSAPSNKRTQPGIQLWSNAERKRCAAIDREIQLQFTPR